MVALQRHRLGQAGDFQPSFPLVDDGTGTAQGRWELSAAQLPGICKQLTSVVNAIIPNILAEIIPGCDDTRRGVLLTVEKAGEATGLPPEAIKAAYDKGKQAMMTQLAAASSTRPGSPTTGAPSTTASARPT